MSLRIAVDYDQCLVDTNPTRLRKGAAEALVSMKAAGHVLILWSVRATPMDPTPTPDAEIARFYETGLPPNHVIYQWALFDDMRSFLKSVGMWDLFDEVWQSPGKPNADLFIDSKAERPDWARLLKELGG